LQLEAVLARSPSSGYLCTPMQEALAWSTSLLHCPTARDQHRRTDRAPGEHICQQWKEEIDACLHYARGCFADDKSFSGAALDALAAGLALNNVDSYAMTTKRHGFRDGTVNCPNSDQFGPYSALFDAKSRFRPRKLVRDN